jgi:hypothetical protein
MFRVSREVYMRLRFLILLLAVLPLVGCLMRVSDREPQPMSAARRAVVEEGVKKFAADVAHDVTQQGPSAWHQHFADVPGFFMVVNGQLAFADNKGAAEGIDAAARRFKHIDLTWGNDLRVDALAPDLAVLGASFTEVLEAAADGHRETEHGFFSGVVEKRHGHWQFRDAHWSQAIRPSAR